MTGGDGSRASVADSLRMDEVEQRRALPELTIVVPTVGRQLVRQALESIAAGSRWPSLVVVVDQSDGAVVGGVIERLRGAGMSIELVPAPRRGPGAARNRGIERVTTRWVVMTDDDQLVSPDWLLHMHRRLEAHGRAVITGMVAPGAPGVPSSTSDEEPAIHTRPMLHRDPLFSGNMGVSMDVVHEIGPFDERASLDGAEDNDWGYRALRHGVPIVYAPEVQVTHLAWRDAAGIDATYRRYARAQGAFYGKHLRHGDAFIALRATRDLLRGPWLFLRAMLARDPDLAMLARAELTGIVPGIVLGLRTPSPAHVRGR